MARDVLGAIGVHNITEFVCWQLANELKCQIFELTASGPASRDFTFRDQIRESATSATANMAEGFSYFAPAQFARFLSYAIGSLGETQNHLLDGLDGKLLDEKRYRTLNNLAAAARRATTNLMLSKQREASRKQDRRTGARRRDNQRKKRNTRRR